VDYSTWRAQAAAELKRLHGIAAERVSERIWKQFYVQNSSPREAADRAQVHYAKREAGGRARAYASVVGGTPAPGQKMRPIARSPLITS